MSLRHFFIASSLILAPITTLGFGSAAFANTASGIIQLSGTVDSQIAIGANRTNAGGALPLSPSAAGQDGSTNVHIADLNITSNNIAGITITSSSVNAGKLKSGENQIAYTIAIVDNDAGTPTTYVSNLNQNVNGFNTETGIKSMDLYIRYSVGGMPKKGTYTDTITITVAD
ncbi:spore coat protein U domain-containing protein [Planktothrix agardhii]|uniref:spore coat protein U domain-containing protein n=1 Tax=Planktothrix agardhii TaxID=1160 RepID=UPI001D0A7A27|nr:spore coat protein U domain-containing protein [Planktothrix agardhii]MCB8775914.1 spore coat protein U domain-containing protein [Planktothrix agardhii 1031]MCF3575253.1 spore coat protein U domain-containing protein [Planktothrix agardhii 1812]MCF3580956.1 spore coat protein U domain-containing protein [Planktothrix agardhii 1811]MCF3598136.1 spore coat protein U domain-containing protein [Planktothrix agardhii 1032]